jgi:4-amino-4-deoxy-L-arabinose transferase-like glycosyltransferase
MNFSIKPVLKRIIDNKPLIAIFVVAFTLRFWGITYGFPLFLNIDEPSILSATFEIKDNLNPDRFDWPHLYFYMNFLVYGIFAAVREVVNVFIKVPSWYEDYAYLFVSRLLTILLGSFTIFPLYYAAKELFSSKKVAYLAALILTFLPIHVSESHMAKLDIAQTLFACFTFYYIIKVFKYGTLKNYLLAGVLIGLTTSIKYNGFLLFLPLLIAGILQLKSYKEFLKFDIYKNLFLSGVASIVAFYVGTPFALIDYKTFWSEKYGVGVLWQFQNVGKISAEDYPIEVYETFMTMYRDNMGFGLWILFSAIVLLFLFFNKRDKHYLLTIFPVIILSLYVSTLERSPSHYFLTFVPMYVIGLSIFAKEVIDFITSKVKINYLISVTSILLLIFLPSAYTSVKNSYLFSQRDTRNIAYDWVKANLNEEEDFLYIYGEDLSMVTFQKNNSQRIRAVDHKSVDASRPFYIMVGQYDINRDDMVNGKRDPHGLAGNSTRLLKYADLMFEQDETNRLGPSVYIFYVTKIGESIPDDSKDEENEDKN